MIFPSISPRFRYSRIVRVLRRNSSAASRSVKSRSPMAGAFGISVFAVFIAHRLFPACCEAVTGLCNAGLSGRSTAISRPPLRLAPLMRPLAGAEASHSPPRCLLDSSDGAANCRETAGIGFRPQWEHRQFSRRNLLACSRSRLSIFRQAGPQKCFR